MLVVLLGWICPAGAATLQISPVMVEMAPQQGASGIMLRNPDAMPVYGQCGSTPGSSAEATMCCPPMRSR